MNFFSSQFMIKIRIKQENYVLLKGSIINFGIPGYHSQGETEKEAIENIKKAIIGCLEVLHQDFNIKFNSYLSNNNFFTNLSSSVLITQK
jgi:hypothetical protein